MSFPTGWDEKLIKTLRQALVDLWPARIDGRYDVPLLTTGSDHTTSIVSFDPPWCNPYRQFLSLEYFLGEEKSEYMVTMTVTEAARKLTYMALKAQGCDIAWSAYDRSPNPRPITDEERRRVLSDYCGKVDIALDPMDQHFTLAVTLYKIEMNVP